MGIDFDETGKNDEYGADLNESTGELGDAGKPRRSTPAAPLVLEARPVIRGDINDVIAGIMGTSQAVQAPQSAAQALETTQDEYMDQVEERLDVAAHFRILLANPMFDNNTKAANIVTFEVQGFIRERLRELLGIANPTKKEETFTPAQVETLRSLGDLTAAHATALRMIASRVTGETPALREPPVHRPAQAPVGPATTPAKAPAGPQRSKPAQAVPGPAVAPAAPVQEAPRGRGRPPGAKNKPKAGDEAPMVQAIRKHPDGTEEPLFDKDGNPRMVRLARVQRPAGALAFPNETQMTMVTDQLAGRHAQVLESNPNVRAALEGLKNPI